MPDQPFVPRGERGRIGVLRTAGWIFSVTAMLTGCTPADPLNLLASARGLEVTQSLPYGEGPRRTLDVYRPQHASGATTIVFFYGGSWQSGSKQTYRFVATALARRGYITMIPDYRVFPEVRYPDFLVDAAHAVAWAHANAARFGGDDRKVVLMGHSAGAYIAAMLAIDPQWLARVHLDPRRDIAAWVGIAGPYDFLPLHDATLADIFGGYNRPLTQPIHYVAGGLPPALLLAGTADTIVDPANSARLADRLRAEGDTVVEKTYAGVGHLPIVGAFASALRFVAPVLRDSDTFIKDAVARRGGQVAAGPHRP